MDTIVWILIFITAFNFLLKQTFWRWKATSVASILLALFIVLTWGYAIEQSKTQIADWLANQALMLDTSVVLTVEVSLQMAFCLLSVHVTNMFPVRKRMRFAYRLLYWFPGVLVFPVLFFGLTQLIFTLPGVAFQTVAWGFAIAVLLLIPLGRWGLRQLLPETDLRLELLFLTNALVAILGIVATVNGQTAVKGVATVDWLALAGCIGIFIVGGILGLLRQQLRKR